MRKLKINMVMFGPCNWVFKQMIEEFKKHTDHTIIVSDLPEKNCDVYQFWRPQSSNAIRYINKFGLPNNSVHMVHESPYDKIRANITQRLKYIKRFDVIACSSQEQYIFYSQYHDNVVYIPFGVFDWAKTKRAVNIKKKLRVGFSARLYQDGVKGEESFYQLVLRLDPNKFELVISSPQFDIMCKRIRRLQCKHTIIHGENPAKAYSLTDVHLILSNYEGTPLPYLENLSVGNYILSTDVGVIKEYTPECICENIKEVRDRLEEIYEDRSVLKTSLKEFPKRVKKLTWENTVKQYDEVYNTFIKPITNQDEVYVVGGGPSVKDFNLQMLKNKDVIAVNASIKSVSWAKYFVTMDYSFFRKTGIGPEQISKHVPYPYFIINRCADSLKKVNGVWTDTRMDLKYTGLDGFNIIESNRKSKFGRSEKTFANGNNSGFCAIQLARILGYKRIHLIGFDMNREGDKHYHKEYGDELFEKNVDEYHKHFEESLKTVRNVDSLTPTALNIPYTPLKRPMIVGYYTDDPLYKRHALEFEKTVKKLGYPYHIQMIPKDNWQSATRYKAKFLLKMLEEHDTDILYIDVDARIRGSLDELMLINDDIGVRWQTFPWRENECLSGTIYLKNNRRTKALCKTWYELNVEEGYNTRNFEQWNLDKAMKKIRGLTTYNLPPEFTFIYDSMKDIYPNTKPRIEHLQASRSANK